MFSLFRKSEQSPVECPDGKCPADDGNATKNSFVADSVERFQTGDATPVNEVEVALNSNALESNASMLASKHELDASRSVTVDEFAGPSAGSAVRDRKSVV